MGGSLKVVKPHVSGQEAMWLINGSMSCCSECGIISLYVRHGDLCPGCGLEFVTAGPLNDTNAGWREMERFGVDHFEVPLQAELEVARQAHPLPRRRGNWLAGAVGLLLVSLLVLGALLLINATTNPVTCEGQQTIQLTQSQLGSADGSTMALTKAIAADELPSPGYDQFEVARVIDQMNPNLDARKANPGDSVNIPIRCYRASD